MPAKLLPSSDDDEDTTPPKKRGKPARGKQAHENMLTGDDELTGEEARAKAKAEGLILKAAANETGFASVRHMRRLRGKPFQARLLDGGKQYSLGYYATAEGRRWP